jgi:membrane protease YdiL (CAAX protease family)
VSSLGKIFLYLITVILAGALAAPQAWHLIQMLPSELLYGLAGQVQGMPFHRYLSRSLQVSAIILLWPLLRSLRIRSLAEFGIVRNPRPWRDLGAGVVAGAFCLALLLPVLLLTGAFTPHAMWYSELLRAVPRVLATAVFVALMEEFLFRGVLLGFLRQVMIPPVAVVVSSAIFSAIHFLNLPPGSASDPSPHWWSGLAMLAAIGGALPSFPILALAFLTLFAAGIILGWLTVRTGSLHAAIGLHAFWIFGQQLFNKAAGFHVVPAGALLPFIGPSQCNGMVPVGIIALAALLLAGFLAAILLRKRPLPSDSIWS